MVPRSPSRSGRPHLRPGPLRLAPVILRTLVHAVVLALLVGALAGSSLRAAEPAQSSPWWHRADDGSPIVDLWVGYSSTCPHCAAAAPDIQALDAELDWLDVHWLQVNGADADAAILTLESLAAITGERITGVPALLYAGRLDAGWADDGSSRVQLQRRLTAYHASLLEVLAPGASAEPLPAGSPAPDTAVSLPIVGRVDAATISLPVLAVTLGGLDALNPCALSVLLFLMSVLAGTRDRRRMLLVGGTFVIVSGIVYFALMAAWLNVFLAFGALRLVTVLAGTAAIVAALINLKDHLGILRGPSLVIPAAARPGLFTRMLDISEATAMRALLPATILVAAVANLYEMLCTGGLPVVFTRVLTLNDLPAPATYAYLALYCLVYVLPAAFIVGAFTVTLGRRGVSVTEARNLKLLSGLLMLGFGILLLFAPELLTDATAAIGLLVGSVAAWLVILLLERAHRPHGDSGGTDVTDRTAPATEAGRSRRPHGSRAH